ncbi:MAG: flavodoxin domain-containing protein [Actinomycetaceae bacterium]|nr:flavodoxin domain-containing protein [Actinomycetaceae bacterium]
MKVLVVFATKSGSTAEVAAWIAEGIETGGHKATVKSAQEAPGPQGYDVVFVGSGIRAGNWHAVATTWLRRHIEALKQLPVVTFTSSLLAADPTPKTVVEVAEYTTRVTEPLGLTPVAHGSLVGAYDPAKMSFAERLIMKAMNMNSYTDKRDPEAVRLWAQHAMESITNP